MATPCTRTGAGPVTSLWFPSSSTRIPPPSSEWTLIRVWLRDYWLADPATEVVADFASGYTVVSSDGETFRRVTLPRPAKVLDVADSRVLAVVQDDLAVQHVVVYALPAP